MKSSTKRKKLSIELIDTLFGINRFLLKTSDKGIAEFDINQTQFIVLAGIVKNKGISQKDILENFLIEKPNLSKTVKKLEQLELIQVTISEIDKRKTILEPTAKGVELFSIYMEKLNSFKELFTQPLSDSELEEIMPAIRKLGQLVELHTNNMKKKI